jgi:primosomal replication protein N
VNRLEISGELIQIEPLRYTPAGVPIVDAVIVHRSTQSIGQSERQVECELKVQASGDLAGQLGKLKNSDRVNLQGVLNRRSLNSRQLILILNRIEKE